MIQLLPVCWTAVAVVPRAPKLEQEKHWAHEIWRAQLGGTQSLEPFISVTATNFQTTQQRFTIRAKANAIRAVQQALFVPEPVSASSIVAAA